MLVYNGACAGPAPAPPAMNPPALRHPWRLAIAYALAALLMAAPWHARAQTTAGSLAPVPASQARTEAGVPLVIYNRTIFVFRAPFLGIEPADRVAVASERILDVLERPGAIVATVENAPQGSIVRVDGVFGFIITPADVEGLGESPADAAQRAARVLEKVIAETREVRDVHAMLVAAAKSVAATVLALVLLWALARARRAIARVIADATARHAEHVRLGGVQLVQRDRLREWETRALGIVFWLIVLLVVYQWLGYVLAQFPYTRPWGEQLTAFLTASLRHILEGIARAMPGLAVALVIFVIARAAARAVDAILVRVQQGQLEVGWLDSDTARPTRRLVNIVIWIFALVMAYPYLPGSNTEAFKGMSVLLGLMVSLGASSVIAQGAAGLILMYTRALRPGEFVKIGEHQGTVIELTMFATRMRTALGTELTLPSALVLGAVTVNYSRPATGAGILLDAEVTIGYDTPWRQVHAMLDEAAHRTRGILAEPAPRVYQTALSDWYVSYHLVCQAEAPGARVRADVISELHAHVQDVFNENGVQIMSPHYIADPAAEKVVPKERWHLPPARQDAGE